MFRILKSVIKYNTNYSICICQRFKGHSKWQNTRHIRAEKNNEKAFIWYNHMKRLRIAIAEGGGLNQKTNDKLVRAIEQAKKDNMPIDNINAFLKKLEQQKVNAESHIISMKGPAGSVLLVHLLTDNIKRTRQTINAIVKKHAFVVQDNVPKGMFDHKGIIITNLMKEIESATEDAIQCNAEDVEEISDENDEKYLQFTCDPQNLPAVRNQLEKIKYNVIKAEELYIPQVEVSLDEEQQKSLEKLCEKLEQLEETVDIYNNIA